MSKNIFAAGQGLKVGSGDEGQRYLISVKRVSDGVRVDFAYWGPPADGTEEDSPSMIRTAAAIKEFVRTFMANNVYSDPELVDRREGWSSKLKM